MFRIAKQKVREKKDVGVRWVVKVSVDDKKKIWKEHMKNLMNVENEWSDSIGASKVEGLVKRIEIEEVQCAMIAMKIGKASGPTGVAVGLFKADGR